MPYYFPIKRLKKADRLRTVESLQRLRSKLSRDIPPRDMEDTLLLATWNLRDFDSNKFGYGPRLPESFHYIAEIISRFDIVALQEVNDDLKPFKKLMNCLGPWWDYITTDVSGNHERGTIVYDKRKVRFDNIAGEIVLTDRNLISGKQFNRTPYLVSFKAGWFKFSLCTVHIYYGDTSGEKLQQRIGEIEAIAEELAKRAKKSAKKEGHNFILLGDFNIVSPEHKTMKALLDAGFHLPDDIRRPTNAKGDKYYDQIAYMIKKGELEPVRVDDHDSSGVFNMYDVVFKTQDWETYFERAREDASRDETKWLANGAATTDEDKKEYFKSWRTWQMSDHLPLWVALKIDSSEQYLEGIAEAASA